jgi:8-oxo-dGTP diphosphatase
MQPVPRVGVGVFVWKDGKFLMLQRRGAHGEGSWSVPGGHLEFGESWDDCAGREVLEETGVTIKNVRQFAITNDIFPDENEHYITIWMASDWAHGVPVNKEPEKCSKMEWRNIKSLPTPLFLPWEQLKKVRPELFQA